MPIEIRQTVHAELLRPEDLLHLLVDYCNLRVSVDENLGPLLSVEDRDQPAFLRFTFAPQTIAETAVFAASLVVPESDPKRPDPDATNKSPPEPLFPPGTPGRNATTVA